MERITPSITKGTDELKRLIDEHPDYPISVLVSPDGNEDSGWLYFCSDVSFEIGEILDCEYCDRNDEVITDRDRLREIVEDELFEAAHCLPGDGFKKAVDARIAELEPFWTKSILIHVSL